MIDENEHLVLFQPIISRVLQENTAAAELVPRTFPLVYGINFFKNTDSPLVLSAFSTSKDDLLTRTCGLR